MPSFKGQAVYSVDSKQRVAVPAKMRHVMNPEANKTFVATRGFEQCIVLYPNDQWDKIEARMNELNMYRTDARGFVREFMMWAEEAVLDGQGRIVLPKDLMEYSRIKDRARIIGVSDHIEIWDPVVFDEYSKNQPDNFVELAQKVMGDEKS